MGFVDVIIILILSVIVGFVVCFSFVKNKKNPCKGCPYSRTCNKDNCEK